ncbi:MAG: nuclear transport factor 2 family protein [Pseudomonadales bacterium]
MAADAVQIWLAKQQVAELRQLYGFATDLIGTGGPAGVEEGRAIYRRIFAADARIQAGTSAVVRGPDAWVDFVRDALEPYSATQHLIGTQRVDVAALPDADGRGGRADMQSYVQAWHAKPDGEVWTFIGTYHDEAVHTPEHGWQIQSMQLVGVSEDVRQLGSR